MNELRHLQLVILEIVKDIDALCRKNSIEYYLFGGSAIGAVRHHGFIPWDDDLDIVMDFTNYDRFIKVCREQLNTKKYLLQEGLVDWPALYSKVRLKGTIFEEQDSFGDDNGHKGIFVDIFRLDNAPNSTFLRRWQYICGKYFLCYCLLQRGYKKASISKKLLMMSAYPLKIRLFRNIVLHQLYKYNSEETSSYVSFGSRFRYKSSFFRKDLYSTPIYLPFEDTQLPVPQKYDEMLTLLYGDYMTPPPVSARQGWHMISIDFGEY